MIKDWIEEYSPQNKEEILSALREIMQEITLAALSRTDFFEKAAFYGGTALRIFYGLERYSEDLDFSLLKPDSNFSIESYFKVILDEFQSLGLTISIKEKKKTNQTTKYYPFHKELAQPPCEGSGRLELKRELRPRLGMELCSWGWDLLCPLLDC